MNVSLSFLWCHIWCLLFSRDRRKNWTRSLLFWIENWCSLEKEGIISTFFSFSNCCFLFFFIIKCLRLTSTVIWETLTKTWLHSWLSFSFQSWGLIWFIRYILYIVFYRSPFICSLEWCRCISWQDDLADKLLGSIMGEKAINKLTGLEGSLDEGTHNIQEEEKRLQTKLMAINSSLNEVSRDYTINNILNFIINRFLDRETSRNSMLKSCTQSRIFRNLISEQMFIHSCLLLFPPFDVTSCLSSLMISLTLYLVCLFLSI